MEKSNEQQHLQEITQDDELLSGRHDDSSDASSAYEWQVESDIIAVDSNGVVSENCSQPDTNDVSDISNYKYSLRLNKHNLLQLQNHDPNLCSLDVRFGDGFDFDASSIDWGSERTVDSLANNTHLKKMNIDGWIETLGDKPIRENRRSFTEHSPGTDR